MVISSDGKKTEDSLFWNKITNETGKREIVCLALCFQFIPTERNSRSIPKLKYHFTLFLFLGCK